VTKEAHLTFPITTDPCAQVFIPTVGVTYTPSHHVDILAALGPMPSAEEWKAKVRGASSFAYTTHTTHTQTQ
jgi:hypothetical protein